jgi:rRNA-processing protein FCF1
MRVALDTSALMMPVECDVRVFDELDRLLGTHELITPQAVLAELEKLSQGNRRENRTRDRDRNRNEYANEYRHRHGQETTAASVGRDLAERCVVVETDATYADDALVELATRGACAYVVTNDGPLRDRLSEFVGVIGLRGQNKLGIH